MPMQNGLNDQREHIVPNGRLANYPNDIFVAWTGTCRDHGEPRLRPRSGAVE